jgi:rfaE bifunctional protein kinase chain/domain
MTRKKLVLVSGNFNVLHPGHVRLLRFAKECGDRLIVAVKSDDLAGSSAYVLEDLRLDGVKSNSLVDEVFLINEPVEQLIYKLKPDIVVKGKEHENQPNPELAALNSYGGHLVFSSGETVFSSLDLIQKEFQRLNSKPIALAKQYMNRHEIEPSKLINLISKYSELRIAVIGDLIIDEYITCEPLGMSQEDPTIVVTPIDSARFIGGAGIVAAHAASLGASVDFFSVIGSDETGKYAEGELKKCGIKTNLCIDETRPTTLKKRYRSKGKSLLKVSHLHEGMISHDLQEILLNYISKQISKYNALIFSDFNYGCLPQPLVEKIIELGSKYEIFMAADSQSSSQFGDISRFRAMDLITPTEREARLSLSNREDGLVVLTEKLKGQSRAKNILMKMGGEGLLVHANAPNQSLDSITDRVAALNSNPKDVAGAGDSLLITSAMSMALGSTIWEAALIGSLAAAVQVSRVGNIPLKPQELFDELAQ